MQLLTKLISRAGQPDGKEEVFLFAHLPKTGGQSLRDCFRKHLQFHREFIHLGPFGDDDAATLGLGPFEQRPEEERARARVILGHRVNHQTHLLVPGKVPRYAIFLREPAELIVSSYNFEMRYQRAPGEAVVPFDQWYTEGRKRNLMAHWLLEHFLQRPPSRIDTAAVRAVETSLKSFWFVGISEYLDRDAPLLLRRIGITATLERANVSGVHHPKLFTLDDSLRSTLNGESDIDMEIYQTWLNRLDRSRKRIADD